jgi:hypothetical protein
LKECSEQKFTLAYLDDIIVYSNDLEEHRRQVIKVMSILQERGLKVKLNKCDLVKREIKFLGQVISYGKIAPDPEKRCIDMSDRRH